MNIMYQQNQIPRKLRSASGLEQLQSILATRSFANRTELTHAVCEEFGFYDARGKAQVTSSLRVLRDLEQTGRIELPASSRTVRQVKARGLGQAVALAQGVPARVDQVSGLQLLLVEEESQLRLWNELMIREHPRGAAVHVGCQLRYLAVSEHGYLGALGFASSALALRSRDQWMGWDAELKSRHLNRVIGMSRFLIRPSVRCQNLASKVLGLCLRRVGRDFKSRYGFDPYLVETFVDGSHSGVSLRASNWRHVGWTTGRGRFGGKSDPAAVKSVYIYELERKWRTYLGLDKVCVPVRDRGRGLAIDEWSEQEFGGAPLGDERRSRRLVKSADIQARQPMEPFTAASRSDQAAVHAHYRLLDQPAESAVTPKNILAPHRQRTQERMQAQSEVLCVQDGTDLNFANHGGCQGMGLISRNRKSAGTMGIHMHSLLALDAQGVPLGVPHIEYGHLDDEGTKTQRWLRGLRASAELAAPLEKVRMVAVMDREADCFEVMAECRRLSDVELLVRAQHNRSQGKGQPKMFDAIRGQRAQASLEVPVLARSARRSSRSQKAMSKQPARMAQVELRWRQVQIQPTRGFSGEKPLRLNLVHVYEAKAGDAVKPLEWFLLTSLAVNSAHDATQVVQRYRLRWRIEDWHKILKSGCKVEFLKHRKCERIERAVTINAVIAWRLAAMTLLGRETPELPMEVLFSETEIGVLKDFARQNRKKVPQNLGAGVVTMAMLAGYLNRKNDPPPGYKKIWEGYSMLTTMARTYDLALYMAAQKESWFHHNLKDWIQHKLSPD